MYDAKRATFEKVVFTNQTRDRRRVQRACGKTYGKKYMDVAYAYQNIDNIPKAMEVPEGR